MIGKYLVILLLTLALSGLLPDPVPARIGAAAPVISGPSAGPIFIEFADGARFQVRGRDLALWLAEDAIWLTVLSRAAGASSGDGVNIKLTFPNANPHPRLEPFDRLETRVSFLTGGDPVGWQVDVPVWSGVRYVDLYPGVDLELAGEQGNLVPRLVSRLGADLSAVRLRVEGAKVVTIRPDGHTLRLATAAGDATWPLLRVKGLAAQAVIEPAGLLAFEVVAPLCAAHPGGRPAIQNLPPPSGLLYATWLGGRGVDDVHDIAVDKSGAVYITGEAQSTNLPTTPGAFDTTLDGKTDAFAIKLNAAGSALDYATFLGGSEVDAGYGIAVDDAGAVYITGSTQSSDLPVTPGAFDKSHNGGSDVFVAKLGADGSVLDYSTFFGGSGGDGGRAITVDRNGAAYITGTTGSSLPVTPGAFDTIHNGKDDAFVAKLNAAGSGLDYCTLLGGTDADSGYSIAVDRSGAVYITGYTSSSDLPTTPGAFDRGFNGLSDGFVAKLNAAGSALDYATFLGGSDIEWGADIAVDGSGAAYVTGDTVSADLPTTPGAFDTSHNGSRDVFVAKLNAAGSALDYATFLGAYFSDFGHGIAVDRDGAAYVTGSTWFSSSFPTTPGALYPIFKGPSDAFVAKFNAAGSALEYATFLGGRHDEAGAAIAVDGSGAVYVVVNTQSSDLPTTPGAFDRTPNGGSEAYVAKLVTKGQSIFTYPYLPLIVRDR